MRAATLDTSLRELQLPRPIDRPRNEGLARPAADSPPARITGEPAVRARTFEGTVRCATPVDAPAIVDLMRRCYAGTYCIPEALDPVAVAQAIDSRSACYALAIDPGGALVAQAALLRQSPGGLFEVARVVVDLEHRDLGLMRELTRRLQLEEARGLGARIVFAGAVTSHLVGQLNGRAFPMMSMGLYLGIYPPSVRAVGMSTQAQPISSVLFGMRVDGLETRERRLCLAGADAEHASQVLSGLGIPFALQEPGEHDAADVAWTLRGVSGIGLEHLSLAGADDPSACDDLDALLASCGAARVVWADVPAEHQAAAAVVAALRERGFGFAAYLPLAGPAGEDVLRLQRWQGSFLRRESILVLPEHEALRDRVHEDCLAGGVQA